MTSTITAIEVKFSVLEYVLEVILANELAKQPADSTAQFKEDLVNRPTVHNPNDEPVSCADLEEFSRLLEIDLRHFLDKVAKREAKIRAEWDK